MKHKLHKECKFTEKFDVKFDDEFRDLVEKTIEYHKPKNAFELTIIQSNLCSLIRGKIFKYGIQKAIKDYEQKQRGK